MSHWLFSTLQVFPRLIAELLDILVQQEQSVPSRLKRHKNGSMFTQINRSEKPPRPSGTPPREGNLFLSGTPTLIINSHLIYYSPPMEGIFLLLILGN